MCLLARATHGSRWYDFRSSSTHCSLNHDFLKLLHLLDPNFLRFSVRLPIHRHDLSISLFREEPRKGSCSAVSELGLFGIIQTWKNIHPSFRHCWQVMQIPTRLSNQANESHYGHRFRLQKLNLPSSWASSSGWKKSRESLLHRNVSCEVILNGRLHLAIADNQASANIMSLDFARRERIKVDWVAVPFILVDGSMCYSVGQATAKCALRSSMPPSQLCVFYIFLSPVEPLILGRKFLHENGLIKLSYTPSQLLSVGDEDCLSAPIRMSLSHLDSSRFQVKTVLKFGNKVEEVFLLPDRGSDIDVMSMAYARKIGIDIMPCRPSQESIRLADGRIGRVVGSAYASLHFCGRAHHLETIATHFAIIENPPFEIALGNSSIKGTGIFEDKSDFEWAYTIEDHAILCMLRRSRKRPSKLLSENRVPYPPPPPNAPEFNWQHTRQWQTTWPTQRKWWMLYLLDCRSPRGRGTTIAKELL